MTIRELRLHRGRLTWHERDVPVVREPAGAIVRPFVAARCDGGTLPVSRAL